MTALDIITSAMYKCNAISPGENPSSDEAGTALDDLNDMLDAWQTERLMIYTVPRQIFPLTVLKQSYTMGLGGDFNVPRPSRVERMGIISVNNPIQPLELPLDYVTEAQWSQIPVKNISSSLPNVVWDDQGFPFRTFYFWCIPSVPVAVAIYAWALLGSFVDLSTDYQFPPGYSDALKWNLAIRLASSYGPYVPPTLQPMATEAKARIKSLNIQPVDLKCDAAIVGSGKTQYNWITDSPIGSGSR